MIDEIKANLDLLIFNYPSGLKVNSLIAAKCFGLQEANVCPGNGAAELINSLMKILKGNVGIILPTFEEYPNRLNQDNIVPFSPGNINFSYTADDLMRYYDDLNIAALILINPDNPSGNFIEIFDVLRLAKWAQKKGIRLVVDESFVDFSNSPNTTSLLSLKVLQDNPGLIVVKSISKSYGIPGLRLGLICSADNELIQYIKNDISIWNINSIAEFYLQICEKYKDDYKYGIEIFKEIREDFLEKLRGIKNLRVLPTQANFVMCELLDCHSATLLSENLLSDYNILIKDLSTKKGIDGEYIRITIKKKEENDLLVDVMHELLDGGDNANE